jgi:hypothetical protein
MLTEQEVMDRLRAAIAAAGSQAAYARQQGISLQYVNDVMRGRRELGQKVLDALGVERVVSYRLLDSGNDSQANNITPDDRTVRP